MDLKRPIEALLERDSSLSSEKLAKTQIYSQAQHHQMLLSHGTPAKKRTSSQILIKLFMYYEFWIFCDKRVHCILPVGRFRIGRNLNSIRRITRKIPNGIYRIVTLLYFDVRFPIHVNYLLLKGHVTAGKCTYFTAKQLRNNHSGVVLYRQFHHLCNANIP